MNGCEGILKSCGLVLAFFSLVGLITAAFILLPAIIK